MSHRKLPLIHGNYEKKIGDLTLKNKLSNKRWAQGDGNWKFLDGIDKSLLSNGVVPEDPLEAFKD